MELLTRSVSLTPPTNPEITSIILTKFPYAKLTSKAFGGVTTRFLFTLLGRLGCPLLVILIAWVDSLIFALHLVGVNPTFRACIVPRRKKKKTFWNNCLWGVSSSFWRNQLTRNNKCSAAQRFVYLFSSLEEFSSSPCHPRQHGQPGRWGQEGAVLRAMKKHLL